MSSNIITLANEKGGVGKTFLAVQLALYAAQQFNLKTLVIDLDSQGNATTILSKNSSVETTKEISSADLFSKDCLIPSADQDHIVLIPSPASKDELLAVTHAGSEEQEMMLFNFYNLISAEAEKFDLVVIDTNPNADLRSTAAIASSTHVICPIQLYQESVDGISGMYQRILNGNDEVKFFIIPSMVEHNSYQMKNGEDLIHQLSNMLLPVVEYEVSLDNSKLKLTTKEMYAAVKRRSTFAEAQGNGVAIQQVANSDRGWREMKRVLFSICSMLSVDRADRVTSEQRAAIAELVSAYPKDWQTLLKQYWMSNSKADLPQIDSLTICELGELKKTCSRPFAADMSYLV